MKLSILLCLVLIQPSVTSSNFNEFMIFLNQILIYRKAHFVYSFTCFNYKESVELVKNINGLNLPMSFLNIEFNPEIASNNELNFIIDLSCANSLNVLHKAGKLNLYQSQYKWLFIDFKSRVFTNNSVIPHEITNIPIRMDSDILIAKCIHEGGSYYITLSDLYKMHSKYSNTVKLLNNVLIWKLNNFTENRISKYNQRKNMAGTMLKAAIVCLFIEILNSTSVDNYYRLIKLKNFDAINKLNYNLFLHIQEIYNFTFQISITDKWFGNGPYGVDEGLAELLYNDIVDVSATSALLTSKRIKVLDFVSPTYPFRTSFMFINSETPKKLENTFLKPFCSSVWYYISGFVFLFWLILKWILIIENSTLHSDQDNSWFSTYLLIWAVFCQQGATFVPNPISGRFTLLSLLIMSLILYNYYTSSIVSSLLSGLPPPISTIEELTASNLDVALEDTPYVRTLFKVSNDSKIKNLYSSKVLQKHKEPLFLSVEEGISQVQRGGFAYHTEPFTGYSIIQNKFESYEICNLAEINLINPSTLWVVAQKRSQYKKLFAVGYLKMLESGIISRQQSIWITTKPACLANAHVVQVGISYLLSAYLILMLGGFASVFILIMEYLVAQNIIKKLILNFRRNIWK